MSLKKDDPRYTEKRFALNVKNMRGWLKTTVYPRGKRTHLGNFDTLTVEEIVTVMRVFNLSEDGTDSVLRFCRRFKKAAGEMSAADVREAMRLAKDDVTISEVMGS